MNRNTRLIALTLLPSVIAGCSTAPSDPVEGLLGEWSMVTRIGQGGMDATMTIDRGEGGTLTGSWVNQGMEMELLDICIEENSVQFDREIPGGEVPRFTGPAHIDDLISDEECAVIVHVATTLGIIGDEFERIYRAGIARADELRRSRKAAPRQR